MNVKVYVIVNAEGSMALDNENRLYIYKTQKAAKKEWGKTEGIIIKSIIIPQVLMQ